MQAEQSEQFLDEFDLRWLQEFFRRYLEIFEGFLNLQILLSVSEFLKEFSGVFEKRCLNAFGST